MKIEIDLNEILGCDEEGDVETLQESVRRQVIENLTRVVKEGVGKQIDREVGAILQKELEKAVVERMPEIVEEIMTTEYTPVDRWGDRSPSKTTFRTELVKSIVGQMTYKKEAYESQQNAFTNGVDKVVAANVAAFKSEFSKQVDGKFVAEAIAFATAKLAERLGVK